MSHFSVSGSQHKIARDPIVQPAKKQSSHQEVTDANKAPDAPVEIQFKVQNQVKQYAQASGAGAANSLNQSGLFTGSEEPALQDFMQAQNKGEPLAAAQIMLEAETSQPQLFAKMLSLSSVETAWNYLEKKEFIGDVVKVKGEYEQVFQPEKMTHSSAETLQDLYQKFSTIPEPSKQDLQLIQALEVAGPNLNDPNERKTFIQQQILPNRAKGSNKLAELSNRIKNEPGNKALNKAFSESIKCSDRATLESFFKQVGFVESGPFYTSDTYDTRPDALRHLPKEALKTMHAVYQERVDWHEYLTGSKDLNYAEGLVAAQEK